MEADFMKQITAWVDSRFMQSSSYWKLDLSFTFERHVFNGWNDMLACVYTKRSLGIKPNFYLGKILFRNSTSVSPCSLWTACHCTILFVGETFVVYTPPLTYSFRGHGRKAEYTWSISSLIESYFQPRITTNGYRVCKYRFMHACITYNFLHLKYSYRLHCYV